MFFYKKRVAVKELDKEFENISQKIENLKLPEGFLQFLLYITSELFSNIREHARAGKASIKIEISNKKSSIEISDNGIGLRKSYLLKKIYPKDDFSAIEFALSGLSTKSPDERGFGLYTIRRFVYFLDGEMLIESEKAAAYIKKEEIKFINLARRKKGVTVLLKVPNKSIDFYKIIT